MSSKPEPNLLGFIRDTCLAPFDMEARERLESENYFPTAEDIRQYAGTADKFAIVPCAECTEPLDEATDEVFKCNVCNLYFCVYCWSEHKHES